jgi:hypothetical protein
MADYFRLSLRGSEATGAISLMSLNAEAHELEERIAGNMESLLE